MTILTITVLALFALIGGIFLKRDSDKIYKELKDYEHRAMYGDKSDIPELRIQLWEYKKAWHRFHVEKIIKILAITDARQRWEK